VPLAGAGDLHDDSFELLCPPTAHQRVVGRED